MSLLKESSVFLITCLASKKGKLVDISANKVLRKWELTESTMDKTEFLSVNYLSNTMVTPYSLFLLEKENLVIRGGWTRKYEIYDDKSRTLSS